MHVKNGSSDLKDVASSIVDKMSAVMLGDPEGDTVLKFDHLEPSTVHEVLRALDDNVDFGESSYRTSYNAFTRTLTFLIMPTLTHDIAQIWLNEEVRRMVCYRFLNLGESSSVSIGASSRFETFTGVYAGSLKEPDFYIWPRRAQPLPSIALECAWPERRPDLNRDRDLWLTGGAPHTRVVLIVDFKPMPSGSNRVWGVVEVWRLINGQPVQEQAEIIFPAPTPPSAGAPPKKLWSLDKIF